MTPQKQPVAAAALQVVRDGEAPKRAAPSKKAAARKAPAKRAPRKVTPVSVTAAARSGDRRQLLVALRNRIAESLDDPATNPTALAALIRQQTLIAAEIDAIDAAAAAKKLPPPPAVTPNRRNEAWDESMI